MCLYPRLIRNPKYKANKKNGGVIPYAKDKRALYVAIGCGKCMECRRQKANEWRVRLNEEIRRNQTPCRFVTLTLNEDYYKIIKDKAGEDNIYGQAAILVRRYLERIRKRTGKSVKHWIVPELGHKGTERLHLHGLIWCETPAILMEEWKNVCGHYFGGKDITAKTINYVSKYILKQDEQHSEFQSKIFCSAGIGQGYVGSMQYEKNEYRGIQTDETYRLPTGHRIGLPTYYRNKRWTDEQREQLWMARLDKQTRYVDGLAVDMAIEEDRYWRLLETAREKNERLHYGKLDGWEKARYINSCKKITEWAWKNKKNVVPLQNKKNINHGNEKTKRSAHADEYVAWLGQEKNHGDDLLPTGGLHTSKSIHICEKPNERPGNATNRRVDNNRRSLPRNIPNTTNRIPTTGDMLSKSDIGYECVDIDTGEIFHKPEYGKTYKTIKYEKRSRKITKASGEKVTVWKTIRYVKKTGYEQLDLFGGGNRMF